MEFCKVSPEKTFGTLSFVAKKEDYTEFNQTTRQSKRAGVYVALLSAKQKETIEVIVPPRLNLTDFDYGEVVTLKDVRCVPMSESAGDGAHKGWQIFAKELNKVQ